MRKTVESIQALRGLAALGVVLFHARTFLPQDQVPLIFRNGFAGVDLFFMISGFVMVYSTPKDMTAAQFLYRRAVRILPLYLVAVAVMLAYETRSASETLHGLAQSALFLPLGGDNPPFYGYAPFQPGWTLNYEACFYAVFAVALWLRVPLLVIPTLLGTVFLPQALNGIFPTISPHEVANSGLAWFSLLSNPLIIEFCIGMLLAVAYRNSANMPALIVAPLAVGLIVFGVWGLTGGSESLHGLTHIGAPMLAIFVGFLLLDHRLGFPRISFLRLLGDASYAIYLFHLHAMLVVHKFLVEGTWLAFLIAVALSVSVGVAAHLLMDRPVVRLSKSRRTKSA